MNDSESWRWRWPLQISPTHVSAFYDLLKKRHGEVVITMRDLIGEKNDVPLADLIAGAVWMRFQSVAFVCREPRFALVLSDTTGSTAAMRWEPAANPSAIDAQSLSKQCFAPLQLPAHTALFVSLPLMLNAVQAMWPSIIPPMNANVRSPVLNSTSVPWLAALAAIASLLLLAWLIGHLRRVRSSLEFVADQYARLFPALHFNFAWSRQHNDKARWIALTLYAGLLYWMLLT